MVSLIKSKDKAFFILQYNVSIYWELSSCRKRPFNPILYMGGINPLPQMVSFSNV